MALSLPMAALNTASFPTFGLKTSLFVCVWMLTLSWDANGAGDGSASCAARRTCHALPSWHLEKECDWRALCIICKTLKCKSPLGWFIYSCSGVTLSKTTSCMLRLILLLCCCKFCTSVTLNFPTQISIGFPVQSKLFMDHRCPNVLSPLNVPSVK